MRMIPSTWLVQARNFKAALELIFSAELGMTVIDFVGGPREDACGFVADHPHSKVTTPTARTLRRLHAAVSGAVVRRRHGLAGFKETPPAPVALWSLPGGKHHA